MLPSFSSTPTAAPAESTAADPHALWLQQNKPQLQAWVRANVRNGAAPSVVEAALRHNYGFGLGDIMDVTPSDVGRSAAQGATLGHADELTGAVQGTGARDTMRADDALFAAAHPWVNGAARLGGGAVPGLLAAMIPGLQPVAGEIGLNTLRGVASGAFMGGIAGEGESTKPLAQAGPDAVTGAVGGGIAGGVFGNVASRFGKTGAERAVVQEGSRQLPIVPQELPQSVGVTLQRQHILAPNTGAVADMSDATRDIAKLVALDPKAATAARQITAQRVQGLKDGLKQVGDFYEGLKGQIVPGDAALNSALRNAQRVVRGEGKLPDLNIRKALNSSEVDLGQLHDIRSIIQEYARKASSGNVARKMNDIADGLTSWMEQHVPEIRAADSDYAFLKERTDAAQKTLEAITQANSAEGRRRLAGAAAAATTQVPIPSQSGIGMTVLRAGNRLTGLDPKARANAVLKFFLTPGSAEDAAARMELFDAARGFRQIGRGAAGADIAATGAGGVVSSAQT